MRVALRGLTLYTPSFLPKDWHFPAEKTECDSGARPSPCARFPGGRLGGADAGRSAGGTVLLMIFISGHTPRNVETKLTLGPFHSTTLTRLTQTKGLTAGVACRPPPPFARVGEGLSRNTPTGEQLGLIFRGA